MAYTGIYSPAPQNAFNLERAAARGRVHEADEARKELRRGLVQTVHALSILSEAGVDVKELAQLAHDEITNRDKALTTTIDQAGWNYEELEMKELEEMASGAPRLSPCANSAV